MFSADQPEPLTASHQRRHAALQVGKEHDVVHLRAGAGTDS